MKGSREEILCACLPEYSVLSFWHYMFGPGAEVATGGEVDSPEEGIKVMANKAGWQTPASTWDQSPTAPLPLTAIPSSSLPSRFHLINRKRFAASQSLPSSAIRTAHH